ncbi:hypothetical protein ARC78_09415 [Stenotrophomonas pictorum JCM 9942]|uniref:Lipoprotein n=2 Tax=Stenotrophomonas pictorum TaxID=86184 RepID=A0A0R0AIW4_9GAMM|nr:hypothetical protein ARC78_09415 [Stenotrophomonas pictorum JCM 9942]
MPLMRKTVLLLAAVAGSALLPGCGSDQLTGAQRAAIATLGTELPAPYRDGLVIDSVHRHGDDLVLMIRFPEATVAMAKAKPDLFAALRRDEAEAIAELCQEPALAPVYAAGGGVRRRFVDANGAVFFEVALSASDCPSP